LFFFQFFFFFFFFFLPLSARFRLECVFVTLLLCLENIGSGLPVGVAYV